MKPYRIKGSLVYISGVEELREFISDEVYEVIEDLIHSTESELRTLREETEELREAVETYEETVGEIENLIVRYIHEINQLDRIQRRGVISRLEKIRDLTKN